MAESNALVKRNDEGIKHKLGKRKKKEIHRNLLLKERNTLKKKKFNMINQSTTLKMKIEQQ